MLDEVQIGNAYEATVTFTDANGAPADPSVATIKVRHPATGAIDTYTGGQLAHAGVGVYKVVFTVDARGKWYVKGYGSGSLVASDEDYVLGVDTIIP